MTGSSPLTRGKLYRGGQHIRRDGLIPAHAGKTTTGISRSNEDTAHPRSRGENPPAVAWRVWLDGSSPLTRGKLAATGRRYGDGGLIPAHAGKTSRGSRGPGLATAHPRSRGENASVLQIVMPAPGSSPLTRGKLWCQKYQCRASRLIPAHAGKTTASKSSYLTDTAHPRSRGENVSTLRTCLTRVGSSPLTRGKLPSRQPFQFSLGLIPAHAGKTRHTWRSWARRAAHPRSRGENPCLGGEVAEVRGSSPLTRGKPWKR